MPIYALISVGAEAASELKRLEIALSRAFGFLEKVSETLTSPIQSNFSVLIINTWEDFKLLHFLDYSEFHCVPIRTPKHFTSGKESLFRANLLPAEPRKVSFYTVHYWLDRLFIWLTHRRDLRVELLAGYKLHIRSTKLADFAGFSQSPHIAKRANFLF